MATGLCLGRRRRRTTLLLSSVPSFLSPLGSFADLGVSFRAGRHLATVTPVSASTLHSSFLCPLRPLFTRRPHVCSPPSVARSLEGSVLQNWFDLVLNLTWGGQGRYIAQTEPRKVLGCMSSGVLMKQANTVLPVLLLLLLRGPCRCEGLVVTASKQQRRQSRRWSTEGSQHPQHHKTDSGSGSLLEQIRKKTRVWADTADVETVERLKQSLGLEDVTTNPSIVSATALREAAAGGSGLRLRVWHDRLVHSRRHSLCVCAYAPHDWSC